MGSVELTTIGMVVVALLHPINRVDLRFVFTASVRVPTRPQDMCLSKAGVPTVRPQ